MSAAVLAAWLLASPAAAVNVGGTAEIVAYDDDGKLLDAAGLIDRIARADKRGGPALWAWSPDMLGGTRPALSQKGDKVTLTWSKIPKIVLSLPWPVPEDGFSTVVVDRDGQGIGDGDVIRLNEEIALTQYRLFKEAHTRHLKDSDPQYQPGAKSRRLADSAKEAMAKAQAAKDGGERAKLFGRALREISLTWQKMIVEHGEQYVSDSRAGARMRFGLTLDESILKRMDHYQWIVETVKRSGSNWVRLVFKPNPQDFTYLHQSSFLEYDGVVRELRKHNVKIMGCALDTAQWPSSLTPSLYASRVHSLVLHYKGQIDSWEVGSELNGNWLGGQKNPIPLEEVFRIFSAGATQVKNIEPTLETVATLYWWEGTAPTETHTLFGYMNKYGVRLSKQIDVLGLSLWPEDNPVGLSLERIFQTTSRAMPGQRLMLSSYGYVEEEAVRGYWWLHPSDVDGARKDLVTLLTAGSCALPRSIGGGFWWQALEQMLPNEKRATDLFKVYKRQLDAIGK